MAPCDPQVGTPTHPGIRTQHLAPQHTQVQHVRIGHSSYSTDGNPSSFLSLTGRRLTLGRSWRPQPRPPFLSLPGCRGVMQSLCSLSWHAGVASIPAPAPRGHEQGESLTRYCSTWRVWPPRPLRDQRVCDVRGVDAGTTHSRPGWRRRDPDFTARLRASESALSATFHFTLPDGPTPQSQDPASSRVEVHTRLTWPLPRPAGWALPHCRRLWMWRAVCPTGRRRP